jgi:preprotein translocase subunit SecG
LIEYLLVGIYVLSCLILILFVLLQPGKSDASAIFGGGASSTAFGPRGTQTVLAKVTVGAAVVFFLVAFLFSIPGLFQKKSLGQGITNSPVTQQPPAGAPAQGALPESSASPTPASSAVPAPAKPEASKAAAGNPGAAGNSTAPAEGNAGADQKKPEKK